MKRKADNDEASTKPLQIQSRFRPAVAITILLSLPGFALGQAAADPKSPAQQGTSDQSTGISLLETLNWLKGKIDSSAQGAGWGSGEARGTYSAGTLSWNTRSSDFSTCEVSWTASTTTKTAVERSAGVEANYLETKTVNFTVPLWDMDVGSAHVAPASMSGWQADAWQVVLAARDPYSKSIQERSHWSRQITYRDGRPNSTSNADETSGQSTTHLLFGVEAENNHDTADRVAKAFNHAIEICQKQKPTNKEPF